MGTSASSKGPKSGIPLVPSWVGDNPAVAEPGRFRGARTNLGTFAREGTEESLKRGLGHYASKGLGGAANGTSRMARSSAAAGGFVDVLNALRSGAPLPTDVPLDPASLAGKTQREIADAIIEAITPADGTQDAEASRDSAARAFAEVLEQDPNADLAALTPEQIDIFFESFLANDLVARIQLDVGNAVLDKSPDSATAVTRLEQMQAFVRQELARAIRALRAAGQRLTQGTGRALGNAAIRATFDVFEGWI